ncbi:MAG: response regulator [Candidatus Altimarinota bacterium]
MENLKALQMIACDYTILFVEDNKSIQNELISFLEIFFKEVFVASNGMEGIKIFKEKKPNLILTDLAMPKMNGYDMIKNIREIDKNIEILILSSHFEPDIIIDFFNIGIENFIQKPATTLKLSSSFIKAIQNIQNKNNYY